jgi:hypothetical protein
MSVSDHNYRKENNMITTEFEVPDTQSIAIGALQLLATYGTHVVMHGTHSSMSLAVSEDEALDLAEPNKGDSYFSIEELIQELSDPAMVHESRN